MYCFPFNIFSTPFYHTTCDFSKKMLIKKISKTWRSGKKQRPDLDSAQKTTTTNYYFTTLEHFKTVLTIY